LDYPEGPVDLKRLPQYSRWESDLERYDIWFQDRYIGLVGGVVREFKPEWEYAIVDFSHYGARTVDGWLARRAYAERFKAMVRRGINGSICTFFRQNPFGIDEPPSARMIVENHYHPLHHFERKVVLVRLLGLVSETIVPALTVLNQEESHCLFGSA
jgi:hypothetical protein